MAASSSTIHKSRALQIGDELSNLARHRGISMTLLLTGNADFLSYVWPAATPLTRSRNPVTPSKPFPAWSRRAPVKSQDMTSSDRLRTKCYLSLQIVHVMRYIQPRAGPPFCNVLRYTGVADQKQVVDGWFPATACGRATGTRNQADVYKQAGAESRPHGCLSRVNS